MVVVNCTKQDCPFMEHETQWLDKPTEEGWWWFKWTKEMRFWLFVKCILLGFYVLCSNHDELDIERSI